MRWTGDVALTGNRGGAYRFRWGDLKESDHLEDVGMDGSIIIKWIFKK
jgi:hypothetical protein